MLRDNRTPTTSELQQENVNAQQQSQSNWEWVQTWFQVRGEIAPFLLSQIGREDLFCDASNTDEK
jgi:hypothetical protein